MAIDGFKGRDFLQDLQALDYSSLAHLGNMPVASLRAAGVELAEYSLEAATSTIRLMEKQIRQFEGAIAETEAVIIMVIGGPSGVCFVPTRITAQDPDKIVFEGLDEEGHPFVLIQHISQLNFALRSRPLADQEERRRIGFVVPE